MSIILTAVSAGATTILAIVSLVLANSFRRNMHRSLVVDQKKAYKKLWQALAIQTRLPDEGERSAIARRMHEWYYDAGFGIYLPTPTRLLFFEVLRSITTADPTELPPKKLGAYFRRLDAPVTPELILACVARRHLSLLRSQLKAEITSHIPASTYSHMFPDERALLKKSQIWAPFARIFYALRHTDQEVIDQKCLCLLCPTDVTHRDFVRSPES